MAGRYFTVRPANGLDVSQARGDVYLVNPDGSPWDPDDPARLAAAAAGNNQFRKALVTAPRRSRTVWALGDSLTAGSAPGGGGVVADTALFGAASATEHSCLQYRGGTWTTWALFASEARWTFGGVFATGGFTAAQILTGHVPGLIAKAVPGDTVVVLAGTNGNVLEDVKAIHAALRAAGLNTVAVTIPPSTGSTLSLVAKFNAGLFEYAAAEAIPLVDVHGAVVDPATGAYLAALNGDGVHPNAAGAQRMGQTIAAVLNPLYPSAVPLVGHNAAFTGQLQSNPLALNAPVIPTDYGTLAALGTSTVTAVADAAFRGGKAYQFLKGDTSINAKLSTITLVPGHRVRIGMAMRVTSTGTWQFRLDSNATGQAVVWGFGFPSALTISQPFSRFYADLVIPAVPDQAYRPRVNVNGGAAGDAMLLGEVTFQDLTAMGL